MKYIKIDIDGVLRNFESKAFEILQREFPELDVKLENSFAWDFDKRYPMIPKRIINKAIFNDHAEEIFKNAKPYSNSLLFCNKLVELGYTIIYRTHQSAKSMVYSIEWLLDNNYPVGGYFASTSDIDKNLIDAVLVDDKYENVMSSPDKSILLDRGWNRQHVVPNRAYSYGDILKWLRLNDKGE